MESSQDVVILEVNSGLFVCLFVFGKEKSTGYDQTISGISSYRSRGGKVLETRRSKKSMTQRTRRRREDRTEKRDRGNLAGKTEQGERKGIRRKDIKGR
jgi:hypothetical protein